MENDDLKNKLEEALKTQNRIEEKMKYLENNSDELTEQQLDELALLISKIEETLNPDYEKMKKEVEENFNQMREQAFKNKASQ